MKYFVKSKSKDEFKFIEDYVDSYKDEVRMCAISRCNFHMVIDVNNPKIIDRIKKLPEVYSFESEIKYYRGSGN